MQERLERAMRDLEDVRSRAAPLERERAVAAEEAARLEERRAVAERTRDEQQKQAI